MELLGRSVLRSVHAAGRKSNQTRAAAGALFVDRCYAP